jgi:hypothetical protein
MKSVPRVCTAVSLSLLLLTLDLTLACKSSKTSTAANGQTANQGLQNQAPSQPSALSVDDLVAPIALYPDQLLGQVLTAAGSPQQVLDGGNWLIQNQALKGDALTAAAKQAGFGPPMQYLMNFPQVVDNMCQQMDWTTQLGEAFTSDPKGVMAAIQRKRSEAQQVGNLTSSPQMTVATKTENGQQYVEIKPADPKVVYVPQYNPVTIYNNPAPAAPAPATAATNTTTTTEEKKSGVSTGAAVGIGLLSFGIGMAVGHAISDNNDYYPYPSWGYGGMYYGGRPYYPPPYRPVYPGYRPAPYYRPPANYQWSQYNRNVNINVNNNNYYSRFNNTNVNRGVSSAATRPAQPGWKGQSTYLGARPQAGNQRPGANMATAVPSNVRNPSSGNQMATRNGNRSNLGGTAHPEYRQNSNAVNLASNRDVDRPKAANTLGATNRAGAANSNTVARNSAPPNMNRGGDRGYSAPSPATSTATRSQSSYNSGAQSHNVSAFGGGGSAKAEHQASNRGRASMGATHGASRRNR